MHYAFILLVSRFSGKRNGINSFSQPLPSPEIERMTQPGDVFMYTDRLIMIPLGRWWSFS